VAAGVVAAGGGGVLLVTDIGRVPKYQKAPATRIMKTTTTTIPFLSMEVSHLRRGPIARLVSS